jgi:hypothetical protein
MESTTQYPMGINRFECRSCPYEHAVQLEYYEKTEMKQKEVEDVFGGKEEFANADSVASEYSFADRWPRDRTDTSSAMPRGELQRGPCILLPAADSKRRRADDYVLKGRQLLTYDIRPHN